MPKISRQVGNASQVLDVFVQDATATSGVGLANVFGSTVSYSWWHAGQVSVSSGVASTAGSMGVFSTSAWVQISSSVALGWYQFGAPDGVFASGDTAHIHFYGAPNAVVLPIEIELTKTDNQTYTSSKVFSSTQVVNSITSTLAVNLTQIYGSAAITSAAGTLSANQVSVLGSTPVTSAAGVYSVDLKTIYASAPVTTAAGVLAYTFDLGRTANQNSTVAFSSVSFSTQAVSVGGVNVTSIAGSAPVTTSPGVLATAFDLSNVLNPTSSVALTGLTISTTQIVGSVAGSTGGVVGLTVGNLDAKVSTVLTTALAEGYRSLNSTATAAQLMYEILANQIEFANAGTTRTLNSVSSHAALTVTYGYDSSTAPSSITRTA